MEMIVKKSEVKEYLYDICCVFFVERNRRATADCKLGISAERIYWDATYSTRFLCFHKAEHVNVPKQEIKDISLKKVYARDFWVTCIVLLMMLLYLVADIAIFVLSQGEKEWLMTGAGIFLGGCAAAAIWYFTSRISVLQITTKEKKKYRVPFSLKKSKDKHDNAVKEEMLKDLRELGLR